MALADVKRPLHHLQEGEMSGSQNGLAWAKQPVIQGLGLYCAPMTRLGALPPRPPEAKKGFLSENSGQKGFAGKRRTKGFVIERGTTHKQCERLAPKKHGMNQVAVAGSQCTCRQFKLRCQDGEVSTAPFPIGEARSGGAETLLEPWSLPSPFWGNTE
jgi:hypothetical protein